MKLLVTISGLILLCSFFKGSSATGFTTCTRDYTKIGCFSEGNTEMTLLLSDRGGGEHVLDWQKMEESLHSLACRCSQVARDQGYAYFGIRFWAECWGGKNRVALDKVIKDRKHQSNQCSNHQFGACDDSANTECVGKAGAEYIYVLNDAQKAAEKIDGGFTEWTDWTSCTKSCGAGEKVRERTCSNPEPLGAGAPCAGTTTETDTCKVKDCPVSAYVYSLGACRGGKSPAGNAGLKMYKDKKCSERCSKDTGCTGYTVPVNGDNWCETYKSVGATGDKRSQYKCFMKNGIPEAAIGASVTKYTNWNDMDSEGRTSFLDRQSLSCGDAQPLLTSFHLEREANGGDKIRYILRCATLTTATVKQEVKYTDMNDDGKGNMVFLDRHSMDCGSKGFIGGFKLERNSDGNKIRYRYNCLMLTGIWETKAFCKDGQSPLSADGDGNSYFLDRQTASCEAGYAFSKIHLVRGAALNNVRYNYRCCKVQ